MEGEVNSEMAYWPVTSAGRPQMERVSSSDLRAASGQVNLVLEGSSVWSKAAFSVWPVVTSRIGHSGKYHNTFCLSPQILHKHCFQFLLGLTMVPTENRNNAYAKFGGTNKEYYAIFRNGQLQSTLLGIIFSTLQSCFLPHFFRYFFFLFFTTSVR